MIKLSLSKNYNENYVAHLCTITKLDPHPNADKLQITSINGNECIVDLESKVGDKVVFFPLECEIKPALLSYLNLFSDSNKNIDSSVKGFFESKCRVKAIKLRGFPSEGFLLDVSTLENIYDDKIEYKDNMAFDTIGDIIICKKYEKPICTNGDKTSRGRGVSKENKNSKTIVDNQFKFHISTTILGNALWAIKDDQIIDISRKIHGTSGISCELLINKHFNWIDKLLTKFKYFRSRFINSEYANFCSSRKVIKIDERINDVWTIANKHMEKYLCPGLSVYYEITGFLPSGGYIQKGFDYGCVPPKSEIDYTCGINYKITVYRITSTNTMGTITEFDPIAVRQWCKNKNVEATESFYTGSVHELIHMDHSDDSVGEKLLNHIKNNTVFELETDCTVCKNKVPNEGVVIKTFDSVPVAYKVKSFKFLQMETKNLDKDVVDIESEN